jgi:signal transduction histidine kinase/CheY-like chemotaxis protein
MHGSKTNVERLWALASSEALDRLTDAACRALGAPAALISYFTPGQQHIRSASMASGAPADERLIDLQYSMCRHVIESDEPLLANSVHDHDILSQVLQNGADPIEAYIGVPIRNARGEAVGTLCVYDHRQRQWGDTELALLTELAGAGIAQIERTAEVALRRQAETALAQSEARLAAMASTVPGLIFERRKTGPASWHYTFFGTSREHLAGIRERASNGPLDIVHPDDRERVLDALGRSTIAETDLELTFRAAADGDAVRWLRSQSVVRHDAEGTAIWDGLCFDISDLMAAHEIAEASRIAKDALLVDVNHELRTPLQAILGFADLLQAETRPDVVQAHAATIRDAAQSLLAIVNQLLERASTREGIVSAVDRQPIDIKQLAAACHGMIAPLAAAKGIRSRLRVESDVPPAVLADGPKIQQVLVNLLNNAIKFTETGGVDLRVAWAAGRFRFSVSDTGIGIAEDQVDRLFQRFSQIEPDGHSTGGTGLGLAIAKQLVESMDGTIGVSSNPSRGTTFWFELDAKPPVQAPPDAAVVSELSTRVASSGLILIADDLDLNRKLIADMLSLDGHEVDCVCDGAAAVRAVATRNYDLVLMDMIMPVMDGIAATRAIRALPSPACEVPIIALTAHTFKEQLDTCLEAGMDATLTKPMSLDALAAAVRSWTHGRSKAA